jgi:predicted nucleotidyltransferase
MTGDNKTTLLWNALVGSRAFGVSHAGSDYDYFSCYAIDTFDLLSGRVKVGGCHVSEDHAKYGTKVDVQSHELSRWVEGAMEENLNYMIGLFSPYPLSDNFGFLAELREIVSRNPTRGIVSSALGMARSNIKKFNRHNASDDETRTLKNLRTSMRTLRFAERFISGRRGAALFAVDSEISQGVTEDELLFEMETLEEIADRSSLPSHPDTKPFHEFQLRVRLGVLRGDPAYYRQAMDYRRAMVKHDTLPARTDED